MIFYLLHSRFEKLKHYRAWRERTVLSTCITKGFRMVFRDSNEKLQSHIFRMCKQIQYPACFMKEDK